MNISSPPREPAESVRTHRKLVVSYFAILGARIVLNPQYACLRIALKTSGQFSVSPRAASWDNSRSGQIPEVCPAGRENNPAGRKIAGDWSKISQEPTLPVPEPTVRPREPGKMSGAISLATPERTLGSRDILLPAAPDSLPAWDISGRPGEISLRPQDISEISSEISEINRIKSVQIAGSLP